MAVTETLRLMPSAPERVTTAQQKTAFVQDQDVVVKCQQDEEVAAQRHPLGIRPSGNALTSSQNCASSMGAFGNLPDSIVLLLFEYLDANSLISVGSTCRGLFAYSVYDQLWRDLTISQSSRKFSWRGSWRASRRHLPSARLPDVDCRCLFSDAIYRPFQCSQLDLAWYVRGIPKTNQISRLKNLTAEEFSQSWTDQPFVLTEPVKQWRCYTEWEEAKLLEKYHDTVFRAEAVDWALETYLKYMHTTHDESPLYLFDCAFVEKMKITVGRDGAYNPPECFGEDLFCLLGDHRPDFRWLIIGPERSGSTFHKDPNATSAWNAVVRGSKYWIMFPNSILPPGVHVSEDQSEVTSPLSIAEWLLTFHEEAREMPGCLEGICGEGEVLHVPSGWWHLVVNLEPATAITQNFVPKSHLRAAVNFLKHKADQVSGFREEVRNPYELFTDSLKMAHPALFDQLQTMISTKRKWEDVVAADDDQGEGREGFSFGFDDDLEEEEEVE